LPHPDYLLDLLTSEQLSEWEAYDRLEPVGEYRREYHIAMIASLIHNIAQSVYGSKGKRIVSKPTDFMPWWDSRPSGRDGASQSVEEMKRILLDLASTGGTKQEQKTKREPNG